MASNFQEELLWGKRYERPAAEAFARKLYGPDVIVAELPARASFDFSVSLPGENGRRLVAMIEVKGRRIKSTDYEDTIVVWDKYDAARFTKKFYQVPVWCVVAYTDTLASFRLDKKPDEKRAIYRRDRHTSADHAAYKNAKMEYHPELVRQLTMPTADE